VNNSVVKIWKEAGVSLLWELSRRVPDRTEEDHGNSGGYQPEFKPSTSREEVRNLGLIRPKWS